MATTENRAERAHRWAQPTCPECGAPVIVESTYEPMPGDTMLIVNTEDCISCDWGVDNSRMAEPGEEL